MMDKTTLKKVKVVPKKHRFVSDILPNNGRITEETTKNLNPKEIIRCMQYANCYEGETLLTPQNYLDDPTEALLPSESQTDQSSKPTGSDSSSSGSSTGQTEDQKKENVIAGPATQETKDTDKKAVK